MYPNNSSSDSSFHYDSLSLRHRSNSLFHTSGSRVGFGAKGLSDSESVWSPTSPLDFRLLSNLSNSFSVGFSKPSSPSRKNKHWDCSKVGLGIINSLVGEAKQHGEILGISQRKNIIFGPQVKTGIFNSSNRHKVLASYVKSNSLPKNYAISLLSETKNSNSVMASFDEVSRNKKLTLESETSKNITALKDSTMPSSSLINSNQNFNLVINEFCAQNTSVVMSSPPLSDRSPQVAYSLKFKPSSHPIPIDVSNGYIGSLSAKEIELSEDYTCIISHGPNPKRTHVFGDCILECHKNDLTQFINKEEPVLRYSEVSTFSEEPVPYPSDDILSFCYSCKKKLKEGEDVYIYRGEKAFCSCGCRSEEIFVEEELENTNNDSTESSPDSSYNDRLFYKINTLFNFNSYFTYLLTLFLKML